MSVLYKCPSVSGLWEITLLRVLRWFSSLLAMRGQAWLGGKVVGLEWKVCNKLGIKQMSSGFQGIKVSPYGAFVTPMSNQHHKTSTDVLPVLCKFQKLKYQTENMLLHCCPMLLKWTEQKGWISNVCLLVEKRYSSGKCKTAHFLDVQWWFLMSFKLSTSGRYFYSTGLLMKIYVCNQNISCQKLFCREKIQFGQRNSCWLILSFFWNI